MRALIEGGEWESWNRNQGKHCRMLGLRIIYFCLKKVRTQVQSLFPRWRYFRQGRMGQSPKENWRGKSDKRKCSLFYFGSLGHWFELLLKYLGNTRQILIMTDMANSLDEYKLDAQILKLPKRPRRRSRWLSQLPSWIIF